MKHVRIISVLLIVLLLATVMAGCVCESSPAADVPVESYVAVAPSTMHVGEKAAVTFTLLGSKGQLTSDNVQVALFRDNDEITAAQSKINGKGEIELSIPADLSEGNYDLRIEGTHFDDKASIRVEKSLLIFLETDKPIYKPGQTINIRAITLNSDLLPLSESVTIEVLDAKGIKIFRKVVDTDEYGMASLELPLSSEPNLGVWKINGLVGDERTQLDVRVEEYVLPKYEVKVELPKEWYLVNEPIKGTINAEYSFGKPVKGELEIVASRYVGEWEVYKTFTKSIDGATDFEIPAVQYVAGVPEARGMGNVILDVSVREKSTGYEEKTSRMFTVAETPLSVQVIPEGTVFKPSLPFSFLIVTETPDNQPIDARVQVDIKYIDKEFKEVGGEGETITTQKGKSIISVTPPRDATALQITASSGDASATKALEAGYSPSGNFIHLEQVSQGVSEVGQNVIFKVHSTREAANFYYEVVSRDKVVFTDFTQSNEIVIGTTPQMAPSAKLLVYQILPNSEVAADYLPFSVDANYPHAVKVAFNEEEARPGDDVSINVTTEGKSKVGIVAVDKSVFILAENRLNLQQVFDELERLYMQPQVELHEINIFS
ncbi:MAG: MG2 domain-containing protein, partial [Chloroflexota bacterium]|nr:MG2 domain-containing protein [Chloroflexota bacterium]